MPIYVGMLYLYVGMFRGFRIAPTMSENVLWVAANSYVGIFRGLRRAVAPTMSENVLWVAANSSRCCFRSSCSVSRRGCSCPCRGRTESSGSPPGNSASTKILFNTDLAMQSQQFSHKQNIYRVMLVVWGDVKRILNLPTICQITFPPRFCH